jgi:hypothetical protein
MTQERTFTLNLKNDQQIVLKFTPIAATGDRLWQMFASSEALDTVEHIIGLAQTPQDTVARNKLPEDKSLVKTAGKTTIKPTEKTAKKK